MTLNQINCPEHVTEPNRMTVNKFETESPLHIIIPAYNEEEAIADVIKRTQKILDTHYKYCISVIDDGSKDKTTEILMHSCHNVDLHKNIINRGKGVTLNRGITLTNQSEIVVLMDADGEHPPEEIPKLIKPILDGVADVVIGSRFLKDETLANDKGSYLKNQKQFGHVRKLGNFLFSILIYLFHGKFVTDTQCGFRAYAPGFLPQVRILSRGFQIETEITIKCIKYKWRIAEVRIDNGISTRNSHMKMIEDSLKIIFVIFDMSLPYKLRVIVRSLFRRFYAK